MSIDWRQREPRASQEELAEKAAPMLMFFWNVASAGRCAHIHRLNKEAGVVSDAELLWGDPLVAKE